MQAWWKLEVSHCMKPWSLRTVTTGGKFYSLLGNLARKGSAFQAGQEKGSSAKM